MTSERTYLNYRIKKGNVFYLSSSEPLPGYKKVETKVGVFYHKETDLIRSSELLSIKINESKYGEYISFKMKGEDDNTIIDLSIKTLVNGRLDAFAASAAMSIGNLKLGDPIDITLNKTERNSGNYLYSNIYFKQDGVNVPWTFEYSDVPKLVEKINKITKKAEYDSEDKDAFLYEKLKEGCQAGSKKLPKQSDISDSKTVVRPIEDDDLPF